MAWFEFEAKDRAGTLYRDRLEATDARQAHQILASRQWFVLKVKEEGGRAVEVSSNGESAFAKRLANLKQNASRAKRKHVPEKLEQIVQLLRAGMRLSEVLGIMSKRTSDPAWRAVCEELRSGVVGGKSLSDSMAARPELFNPLFRSMVAAGEASGHLVEVLQRLADYLEKRQQIQARVIQALIYPCIIVIAGISTVVFFMLVMLPKLKDMFKSMGKALPWSTQMLVDISALLTQFGWMIPVLAIVAWGVFGRWLKDPENRLIWDRFILKIPLLGGVLALTEHSRFTQTLATLLQSGVTLVQGLQIAEATLGNSALQGALREARAQVRDGRSLNEALAGQKLFPSLMLDMLAVGERTGDLSGALQHTAQAYERELDRKIKIFTSLIEPILMVVMAAFVGSIVLSVLMAVFDMTSGIENSAGGS
jgi:type II secretory pathway component PulF